MFDPKNHPRFAGETRPDRHDEPGEAHGRCQLMAMPVSLAALLRAAPVSVVRVDPPAGSKPICVLYQRRSRARQHHLHLDEDGARQLVRALQEVLASTESEPPPKLRKGASWH